MTKNMILGFECGHSGCEVRTTMGDGTVLIENASRRSVSY